MKPWISFRADIDNIINLSSNNYPLKRDKYHGLRIYSKDNITTSFKYHKEESSKLLNKSFKGETNDFKKYLKMARDL